MVTCECGKAVAYAFMHCKSCMDKHKPSDNMVLVVFGNGELEAYCRICGRPVYTAKRTFHAKNLMELEKTPTKSKRGKAKK